MDSNISNPPSTPAQPTSVPLSLEQPPVPSIPVKKKSNILLLCIVVVAFLVVGGVFAYMKAWPLFKASLSVNQNQIPSMAPAKKLIIGTDATYPPMETHDAKGNLVGYDIDLGKEVAKGLGMEAEFKTYSWDDLFPSLEQGTLDVIISSVTITDERKQKYAFSDPYFNAGQVVVMKKIDPAITTPDGLRGKKVGVQKATTSEAEAIKYASTGAIRYDDYIQAVASLSAGNIAAIIVDLTAAKGLIDADQNLTITSDPFTKEYYGIVIKKENVALQKKINSILISLKQKGTLDSLKQRWFK